MRLFTPLAALLSVASIVPAALAAVSTGDKPARLAALSTSSKTAKSGVIQLSDDLYDEITASNRNYSAMVLLTAMDSRFGCVMCREFQPEYELLAKNWVSQHKDGGGLFFASLDFGVGRSTFGKLGLNTAPVLYLFPPTVGPDAQPLHTTDPIKFEFVQNNIPAEAVARFISSHITQDVEVVRPFDWSKLVVAMGSLLVAATILKLSYNTLKPALYSRNLWAAISLILILLFTSGHMFNHIRHVPYVVQDGRGGLSYIAGGFSNQFGLETQIVAVVYAVLAFCAISLGMKMPRVEDPSRQKFYVLAWNAVMLVGFSFLMNLFKQKNGAYPFYLPPIMG